MDIYRRASRLNGYGFEGWVGPEPHGPKLANSGMRRDPLYAREVVAQIEMLDAEKRKSRSLLPPWLMVSSFVNPHGIVFFGAAGKKFGLLSTRVDLLLTLLDLAGIDAETARAELAKSHTDARPLVGPSLSPVLLG